MNALRTALFVAVSLGSVAAAAASTPPGILSCQGGGGMRMTIATQDGVFIAFTPAAQPANAAPPGPGECAWADRPFAPGEALGTFIMVKAIANAQVVDSTPLSPGPTDDGAGGGGDATADGGDALPTQQTGDSCGEPGATATVVIPEPHLTQLNVRSKPGGEVLGRVQKGEQVTLIGPCGSQAAAAFAKSNKPVGGAAGWCQIDSPIAGCVLSRYLDFSGGDATGGAPAAGFAKRKVKTQ
jgi:hypothetical protein